MSLPHSRMLPLLILLGCDPEPSSEPFGGAPDTGLYDPKGRGSYAAGTWELFLENFIPQLCELGTDCGQNIGYEDCVVLYTETFAGDECSAYNPDVGADCLEQISTATCGDFNTGSNLGACTHVFNECAR